MKKVIFWFTSLVMFVILSSCHGVRPNADEEAVLIKKPWFFGHGGVDETPVTTGCTWCWWSTSSETFKIVPVKYEEKLDDIISNEKYNFTFWSSNAKSPSTANLKLDFSDKTVYELMKEKPYTGKEFEEFVKNNKD